MKLIINGFALSLALKQRLGETWKWPIVIWTLILCHQETMLPLLINFNPGPPYTHAVLVLSFPSNVQVCSFGSVTVMSSTAGCVCVGRGGEAAKPVVNRIARENSLDTS